MDIFVGSLPFKIKEKELREVFEKYGEVTSVTIIINKSTRQNKGFGFVEMPDNKQAMDAIELLNGSELMGRTIVVSQSEDKEKTRRPRNPRKPEDDNKEEKKSTTWRKNFFRKKPKEKVITYGDQELPSDVKREIKGKGKKAKNFKVGKKRR